MNKLSRGFIRVTRRGVAGVLALTLAVAGFTGFPVQTAQAATVTLYPTGDGTYTAWENNWDEVNETSNFSCSGGDYVRDHDINNEQESFAVSLSSIPNGSLITSIDVKTYSRDDDDNQADGGSFRTIIRLNGTDDISTGSPTSPSDDSTCAADTDTFNITDTVKTSGTTLEIGVSKQNNAGKVRVGAIHAIVTYTADTTKPNVTVNQAVTQGDPTSVLPINFTIEFSEAIDESTFTSADITTSAPGSETKTLTKTGPTTWNLAIAGMTLGTVTASIAADKVKDLAGNNNNSSTSSDNQVTLVAPDTTAPTVTINQKDTQTDPTDTSPIKFTVVFNEAVTDFDDAGDVTLSGTAGATTVSIAPQSATTYEVSVSGMTGNGTVIATVPAGAAKDSSNNLSGASSSTDNQVTYHVNVPPVANDQTVSTAYETPIEVTLTGSDPDSGPSALSFSVSHPNVNPGSAPNKFVFTPPASTYGTLSFDFTVSDGEDTDTGTVTVNVSEPNVPEQPKQCVVVSNELTLVDSDDETDSAANLLTFEHPGWVASTTIGSLAEWIWGDDPVENPTVDETQTFTRTFSLMTAPSSASLTLASDNGYLVKVNGVQMGTNELASTGNTFNPATTIPVTGLVAGTNTIEVTVINKATPGDSNPANNPAGLIFKLTVTGADCGTPDVIVNSCIAPDATGSAEAAIPLGSGPAEEDTLQEILDAEYGVNAPDAATEQDGIQRWSASNKTVHFTLENLSKDSNSAHSHVFGYYLNGSSTFTPVFREGFVGAPYDTAASLPYGSSMAFSVAGVNDIVFAIADWDGSNFDFYATDKAQNALSEDHAVVYNVDDNLYALAFEDLSYAAGDEDFNDVAVSLTVTGCEDGAICEPGTELLDNKGFEAPVISGSWNVVPSGTSGLEWAIAWINAVGAPTTANAEFQSTVNGWLAHGGSQYAELDSDWGGPSSSQSGEAGAVTMSQDIPTVPGEEYTFSFWFSPRPDQASGENKVEALADGNIIGTTAAVAGNGTQTAWTQYSFTFTATDALTTVALRDAAGNPNNSVGSFVDDASVMCKAPEPSATIHATKIVCDAEVDLPNWGDGYDGETEVAIDADTAADFLAAHEGVCREVEWDFEWTTNALSSVNPGDNDLGPTGAPWTLFQDSADVPVGVMVWIREVIEEDYLPFMGAFSDNEHSESAEIYCSTDVYNYDNWDYIENTELNQDYYCVAFNVPEEGAGQCNPEEQHILTSGDGQTYDESGLASLVSSIHSSWVQVLNQWIWKDAATGAGDAAVGGDETFTRSFTITGTPEDSTLSIAADNAYVVKVNGYEVCANSGEFNYGATANCAVPASVLVNGTNTITFEVTNLPLSEGTGTPSTNPAGLLYTLTVNENECEVPEVATVHATKIVCEDESYLPNMNGGADITASTASAFLAEINEGHESPVCWVEDNWQLQYAAPGDGNPDGPEDNGTTPLGSPWVNFPLTDENGETFVQVLVDDLSHIEVREVLQAGYQLFSGGGEAGHVSAEIYCADDVLNYDNWESILNLSSNAHYYCVAFNALTDNDDGEGSGDGEGTLVIQKVTEFAENGLFDFDISGSEVFFDADVSVTERAGSTSITLPVGSYSVSETDQDNWHLAGVSCSSGTVSGGVAQITITEGETVSCTFHNEFGNNGGGGDNDEPTANPQVLGASASESETCGPLLSTYMRMGADNDASEVANLQDFLNGEMSLSLPISGSFGTLTDEAVRSFQVKYWEEVLQPWFGIPGSSIQDQDDATGYVYKTTRWKINNLFCPGSEAMPVLP